MGYVKSYSVHGTRRWSRGVQLLQQLVELRTEIGTTSELSTAEVDAMVLPRWRGMFQWLIAGWLQQIRTV
jgi:hypothetical protein